MLIKVTNFCSMGCSHCMEDSTTSGQHMTEATFRKALEFTVQAEEVARKRGCVTQALLSGGECTEHPDFLQLLTLTEERGLYPILITNGMWLGDERLRKEILAPKRRLLVQVTNDSRFYPKAPPTIRDRRVAYVPALTAFMPLGRGAGTDLPERMGVRRLRAPASFNLRSAARATRSFQEAVAILRERAALGSSGNCSPAISENGDVVAGETRFCWKIGTVDSTMDDVTRELLSMGSCDRCGLEGNLGQAHKRALGLTTLYLAGE